METASHINKWKKLLNELESTNNQVNENNLKQLADIFEHMSPQTAPRLQRDYEICGSKSCQLIGDLFDKIDASDKQLLNSLLNLSISYGNFRLAQITYHIESPRDEFDPDTVHTPTFVKTKWHDLSPLLPPAGAIGWKHILIHGLVIEERQLFQTCLRLLTQKLHFHAIVLLLDRFKGSSATIQKNGERVSEKLAEKILDFANDDEEMIGIDSYLFNLLLPFTNAEQQAAIIEAIIRDRFKPHILQEPQFKLSKAVLRIRDLISECIMNRAHLQEVLIIKLLEHLRFNLIRRKRRHSVEATDDGLSVTLESLIGDIISGIDPINLLEKIDEVELSSKKLQTLHLSEWIQFLNDILTRKTLTPRSSIMIISTCSVLIVTTSKIISHDLTVKLSLLMTKTIDNTGHRKLEKLFKACGANYLISFTKVLADKTELLEVFNTPLKMFYRSYFARHMRFCAMKGYQKEAEKFSNFVNFICDKSLDRNKCYLLEYICLHEICDFLENLKNKGSSKLIELYVDYSRSIGKKLFKFIKHHTLSKSNANDIVDPTNGTNGSNGSKTECDYQAAVVDALICILKIAIDRKEQDILDTFGEMMLKLFNLMCSRIEELAETVKKGTYTSPSPLDSHLPKLMILYVEHKAMIESYICYDLNDKICNLLIFRESAESILNDGLSKNKKKLVYNEIKTRLEALQDRAGRFNHVYQTIINKQYNSVVDQSIGHAEEIKKEESCCKKYLNHMKSLGEMSAILLNNCGSDMYNVVLNNIVRELELCDALDHPKVLYLFLILEALIPKNTKETSSFLSVKEVLPRISCSLIRISKSVELGPSVHSFTRPGTHKSGGGIQCCIYANCIQIYTLIFSRYPPKITNPLITDAMQISVSSDLARYAKYSTRLHKFFIQLASAISGLLKAICIGRKEEDILRSSMPIFLSVFSLLIRCIILASDRQKLEEFPRLQVNGHADDGNDNDQTIETVCKIYEAHLEFLARDIGRMMNNLSCLEVKLIDYAPHLISTYIKDTQRASCPNFVKKHLDEGIFRIFNLVDAHQKNRQEEIIVAGVQRKMTAGRASGSLFEMIHARLDQASREIFRSMHDNYNRFHRYLGKC